MIVSTAYVEARVEELNSWLSQHSIWDERRKLKEYNRAYYIGKLTRADELGVDFIKI